jgi:hypothetical protein
MTVNKLFPPPSRACKATFKDKPVLTSVLSKMMQVNDMSLNQVKKHNTFHRT